MDRKFSFIVCLVRYSMLSIDVLPHNPGVVFVFFLLNLLYTGWVIGITQVLVTIPVSHYIKMVEVSWGMSV